MNRIGFMVSLFTALSICRADGISREQERFFEMKIRPVLVNSCFECHSKKTGKNEGGLTLDTKVGLRQGGNSGPGVTPHNLDKSWIWMYMTHSNPDQRMPPDSTLSKEVIADFESWIRMGAPDPRDDGHPAVVSSAIDIPEGRRFWSFQQPRKSPPPRIADAEWSQTAVDRFVRAKLKTKGLKPAPRAEASVLLRRLYFDLVGLPPGRDDIARFELAWKRDRYKAIESETNRLIESEQFGERWGRHWLDVARYAESNGKQSNQSYPTAWKYRDYVIDSFNNDKPFDRFVQEQIAGDLLPARNDEAWREGIIATGFLAVGPKPLREKSARQFTMDVIDEQIDATSQAILGLTVACARCHDHKSDPIPTADYYALAGIFMSSSTHYGTFGGGQNNNRSELLILPAPRSTGRISSREIAAAKQRLKEVGSEMRAFRNQKLATMQAQKAMAEQGKVESTGRRSSGKRLREEQNKLNAKLGSVGLNGIIKEYGMGMQDRHTPVNAHILVRGEVDTPAQEVQRGFLQVLNHGSERITNRSSGRRELAEWMTSRQNPLTARVFVNRVWDKLFGRGLVSSPNNFGTTGMRPTHPELLDYVAVEFMDNAWSVKSLVRSLVLTRTYQASSQFIELNYAQDPDNETLWRAAPRRLDAEAIRDAMLAVSGQLDRQRPDGSRVHDIGNDELGRRGSPDLMAKLPPIRSVYLPAVRDSQFDLIELFDGADTNVVTGHRDSSNLAGQALYMMNSAFVLEQSDAFAKLLQQQSKAEKARIDSAFISAFGRPPSNGELSATKQFLRRFAAAALRDTGDRSHAEWMALSSMCQGLLTSAEFRFLN